MKLKINIPESLVNEIQSDIENIKDVKIESLTPQKVQGGSAFEPFTVMLITITTYAIVSRLLNMILDQRNPGVVVHLDKNGNLSVQQNSGIPNSSVLFVSTDGQKEMFNREDIGKGLLEAVISKYASGSLTGGNK